MSPLDDYQDEMSRLTSEQIESILEGSAVDGPAGERLSDFVRDLREGLVVDPDPETASRHLTAMAAADLPTVRRLRPRRVTTKLAFAAVLLLGAGVATAATVRLGAPGIVPDDFPIPVQTEVEPAELESEPLETTDDATERPSRPDDGTTTRAPSARSTDGCQKAAAAAGAAAAEAPDPCAEGTGKGSGGGGKPAQRPSRPDAGDRGAPPDAGGGGGGQGSGGGGGAGGPGGGSGSGSGGASGQGAPSDLPTP